MSGGEEVRNTTHIEQPYFFLVLFFAVDVPPENKIENMFYIC